MTLNTEFKAKIIQEYQTAKKDTGSVEVQCAILTERIKYLTDHLKEHKKDHSCRRSLLILVNQRKKLLGYLKAKSITRYNDIINKLSLRK
ncbi:30S ribosomal protein S15 [Rickettsiales bacterium]|nr:30S ribosomal protein S15 [Rickettsiales bacterium]MDB2550733.1 30S ribosomal protein S15 [Rickettsiales bacterium]